MVRIDTIEFHHLNDFGYGTSFILNEYYLIFEGRLPDADYR